jgi:hypothetical protein
MREVSNYLDGDLDAAMRLEIETHLKDCGDCLLVINQTRLTVELFCDERLVDLSPELQQRFRTALRRHMQSE